MRRTRWIRKAFWAAGVLVLLSVSLSWITLNFWQRGIAAALSRGLGRPVEVGAVHLRFLDGPGFEVENVAVGEDPRFGIEPFARMESLRADLALESLWQRQLKFSKLVFVRPSLNAVRNEEGKWNLATLGSATGAATPGEPVAATGGRKKSFPPWPHVRVESGRINWKSQGQKKVYVIDDLDLELTPPSSAEQPWSLRFEGTPSRTDAAVRPVSRVRGEAEFGPFVAGIQQETGAPVRVNLSAEKAFLGDLLRVFLGSDYGIHGLLNFQLHLAGTTSLLRMSGRTSVEDLHRWDLLPPVSAPELHGEITGFLDPVADSLELTSLTVPLKEGSVTLQGRIVQLSSHPWPELRARFRKVSLTIVAEIARSFTPRLGTRFEGQGSLDGQLELAGNLDTLEGRLRVSDGVLQDRTARGSAPLPNGQRLRLSNFRIDVAGKTGKLGPVTVSLGKGSELGVSLRWDLARRSSQIHLEGEGLPIAPLVEWGRRFSGVRTEALPAEGSLALRADVSLAAEQPPEIRGRARISGAAIQWAALRDPLRISDARLTFRKDQLLVKPFLAGAGAVSLQGSFRVWPFLPAQLRPAGEKKPRIEFDLQAPEIDLAELERLLKPPSRSALFFGLRKPTPPASAFWSSLVAKGSIHADSVAYRGAAVKNFRAALEVHDRIVEVRKFFGEFAGGTQTGKATFQSGPDFPSFRVEARYANWNLEPLAEAFAFGTSSFSGKLSGELRLAGSGRDRNEILAHLGGSGTVTGSNWTLPGLNVSPAPGMDPAAFRRLASFSAAFQIAGKELVLTEVRVVPQEPGPSEESKSNPPPWVVIGTIGFDRRLDLRAQAGAKGPVYRWTGSFAEPRLEEIHAPETSLDAIARRK